MKAKTKATLCLKVSGEVSGAIANENDTRSVSARHSGAMTDDEFRKCLKLIEKVCLGGPQPISIGLIGKLLSLCRSRSARRDPLDGR